ncbi:hypothetical protein KM043_002741 [Ampulex compressa]|nr:hypothetical protein KM043_002741 [Ampulex compressa]
MKSALHRSRLPRKLASASLGGPALHLGRHKSASVCSADSRPMNDNLFGMGCRPSGAKVVRPDLCGRTDFLQGAAGSADREIVSRIGGTGTGPDTWAHFCNAAQ